MVRTNYLFLLVLLLIAIPFSQSQGISLGTYRQGDTVSLIQTCDDCTYVNLSSVILPNSTTLIIDDEMTQSGTTFSYSFSNTQDVGTYVINGVGDPDGELEGWSYTIEITYAGKQVSQANSTLMVAFLFFLLLGIFSMIKIGGAIPTNDSTDEYGNLIQINMKKHFKPLFYGLAWVFVLLTFFVVANLSYAYLPDTLLGTVFMTFFRVLGIISIIALPFSTILIILKIFRDKETQNLLNRGVFEERY